MKAKYIQTGAAVDYTPDADVSAGDVVVQGEFLGIAKLDIETGKLGALATSGVFDVAREAATAFTKWKKVYWDADGDPEGGEAGTGAAVDTAASGANEPMGFAIEAAADEATQTTVRVLIVKGVARQAANLADSTATDVAGLVVDFNALLAALQAAGLMASA